MEFKLWMTSIRVGVKSLHEVRNLSLGSLAGGMVMLLRVFPEEELLEVEFNCPKI